MKPTYAAVVGKVPLRRTRSEEFPPLVRDPLPLSQNTQPTGGAIARCGEGGGGGSQFGCACRFPDLSPTR